jgi:LPXTG cell wall anchor motif
MKNMLLTAAALGAVIAGLALYYQKKNKPQNRIKDAAKDAYQTMNEGIGSIERPMQHAMG